MRASTVALTRVGVDTPTGATSVRRVRPYRALVVVRPETFAERLRRLRNERGLTQYQLADLAGLNQATVAQCEGGLTGVTAHTVAQIARALGTTMGYLWANEEGGDRA